MAPTLILGIGNILMRDEGVGVRAIEAMARLAVPEGVEILDGGTAGLDLVDAIANRRKVIVIDAAELDAEPGTVLRFSAKHILDDTRPAISMHEFGLVETLRTAKHLGCAPHDVVVIGVQPETVSVGLELSDPVKAALPAVIDLVLAEARG
jgi:hydrogenase maturation protease